MSDLLDDFRSVNLYKETPIWAGTLLGGPICGAYFIAYNFKEVGEVEKVKKTWLIAIGLTVLNIAVLVLSAYFGFILLSAIPLCNMALANILVTTHQQPFLEKHELQRGHFLSAGKAAAPIILGFLFYALPMIVGYFVLRTYLGN